MSILYIVTKIDFEYNDEIYYTDNGGGHPVKAFRDKQKAIDYKNDLAYKYWFENPYAYGPSPNEFSYENDCFKPNWVSKVFPRDEAECWEVIEELNVADLESSFVDMYGDEFTNVTKRWPKSVKRKMVEHAINIEIFTIHEVEIDEAE